MKSKSKLLIQWINLCLMLFLGTFIITAKAQNNFVSWSSFNMGFAESKISSTIVKSVAGQSFVGASQQDNIQIISGFLADTLFRTVLTAVHDQEGLPSSYSLGQNYPNPFNPSTTIKYQLPVESKVTLTVYNMLGQVVKVLADEIQTPGHNSVEWDASSVASGVYFYRLYAHPTDAKQTGDFVQTKKLLLLR